MTLPKGTIECIFMQPNHRRQWRRLLLLLTNVVWLDYSNIIPTAPSSEPAISALPDSKQATGSKKDM